MVRAKTLGCLIALAAAGCSSPRRIVVGSKNFTEQNILGEILAQQIERKLKVSVERKLNLQGTLLAQEALESGSIDLYPEYTGTALSAILKLPLERDPAAVLERVRAEYERRWRLRWLPPLGFEDTFAMVIRGPMARRLKLRTVSEAARRPWKLGVGYEFLQRPDGLAALKRTYGLRLAGQPVTMDLGLLYRALEGRQVDMVAGNSTDGQIAKLDVAVLEDDRHAFPPYQCAVVVREPALAKFPGLLGALEELSGTLSETEMRRMNYEVEGEHRPAKEVARQFVAHASACRRGLQTAPGKLKLAAAR